MTTYSTSGTTTLATTRDLIILRALRIIGAIGSGETAAQNTTLITESAQVLNELCKEWEADGMPLWAIREYVVPCAANVAQYYIANGPLKVLQGWRRDSTSTPNVDSPMIVFTRNDYNLMSSKGTTGTPNQLWYDPPGNLNQMGTLYLYPTPDSTAATYQKIFLVGQRPFELFNVATDIPDFPAYWHNAITWGLADQLSYEHGVGVTERAQISKKSLFHKEEALGFGVEEGSFRIQPMVSWWS